MTTTTSLPPASRGTALCGFRNLCQAFSSRNSQTVLASGTLSHRPRSRKRMKEGGHLSGICSLVRQIVQRLADRGYDADWFRDALEKKGIKPSIPGQKSRKKPQTIR